MPSDQPLHHSIANVPLTAVNETVKAISFEELGEDDRAFFQFYFFELTNLHRRNMYADYVAAGFEERTKNFTHDQEQQSRRFSLGTGLSRSRYHVICQDPDGDSGQTLAMEILNYANPMSPHVLRIFDLKDPAMDSVRETLAASERDRAMAEGWRMLLVEARTLGSPNSGGKPVRRLIPYRLRRIERNAVFDLRNREALEWLFVMLNGDWPNAVFLTALSKNDVDFDKIDQATGGAGPPLIGFEVQSLLHDAKTNLLRDLRSVKPDKLWSSGLAGSRDARLKDYHDLFSYLLAPENGGGIMTTLIAICLHELGADAIIFPSARENCGVSYQGHKGFNLVDFAGIGRKPPAIYIAEEPSFFVRRRSSRLELKGAAKVVPGEPVDESTEPWGWAAENHRSITIGRHRWWVLKNYLQRTFPDYDIPRLLVKKANGQPGHQPNPHELYSVSDILCGIFDGTLALSDQAWGFHWMAVFETPIQTLGEWLAELASRVPLFGMQATRFQFDGVRALRATTPGLPAVRVCVCCGWKDAPDENTVPEECPSCGFHPVSAEGLRVESR